MSAVAELLIKILGDATGGKRALDETGQAAEQTGQRADKLKNVLQDVARVGLAALSAGLMMGIKSTNELNQHMSNFSAQTGMMGEEAEKAKRIVQDLYKVNEDSYEDLVGTITALRIELQASADEMELYTQGFLDFAKVTGQDDVQAVENLSRVIKAWNLDISDSGEVMDALLAVKRKTGAEIVSLQQNMAAAAPAMRALGMSWQEGAAYLGMLEAAGIKGQAAVSAFNYATRQVESPEELRRMIEDMAAIEDPTLRAQAAAEIFGARAGPQMAQAIGEGRIGLDELMKAIQESEGIVTEASAVYDDNFNVKFALFRKRIEGTVQELVEGLGPGITTVASIATGTAAVWPGFGNAVAGAFGKMRIAAVSFFTFLAANPIALIIGVIVLVIAGLYLAWKNNLFGIQDVTQKGVDWLQNKWDAFKNFLQEHGKTILLLAVGPAGWAVLLAQKLGLNMDNIRNTFSNGWNNIRSNLSSNVNSIYNDTTGRFSSLVSNVRSTMSGMIDAIVGPFRSAYQQVRDYANRIREAASEINPFKRHSPSLVEQVQKGLGIIRDEYAKLGDIRIEPPSVDDIWPGWDAPPGRSGAGGMVLQVNGPLVSVDKMEVRENRDIQKVSQGLHDLTQAAQRSAGRRK